MSNMRTSTKGAESTTSTKSRSTASYYKTIRESTNINKRQRPRIAVPLSSLLFSFGPTTTKKKDNHGITAMADVILDDVLATLATTTTPPPRRQSSENISQGEHRQINHRVSFSTQTDIKYITSRYDISSKEYKDAWYSRAELDRISESCLEQIHSITTNRNNYSHFKVVDDLARSATNIDKEEESFCIRGLESFTPVASKAKKMSRSSSVQAVLNEQSRQKQPPLLQQHDQEKDVNDDHAESIRKVYHGITSSSQLWAHAVALKDRREAEDMMMDEEECCRDREVSTTTGDVMLDNPLIKDGVRRLRGVSRSHSSNSANSATQGQSKKRCIPCPRRNGPVTSSTTSTCRWDTTRSLHGADKAMRHRVVAIAA